MKILLKDGVTVLERGPLVAKYYVLKRGASYLTDENQKPKGKKAKKVKK